MRHRDGADRNGAAAESWAAYAGVFTTDGMAVAGRSARDYLRDLFELLGIPEGAVRLGGENGRLVVVIGPLAVEHAGKLARTLMSGVLADRLTVDREVPLWSRRHGGVGVVTGADGHRVTLRCLATGERWETMPSELRIATLTEITGARGGGREHGETDR
ncbi:hypothetical protein [Streptomyces aidingensis]|uniref:Uncharacterized protein n=1 Tax=Streptomyces aidingensis TaxID=910347 RepID=A0A1I1QJD2_9ACTN|nr:hypothetical protein [Streptomyces aidingensis]SFD19373.1 hypothetical protein SAMN05421773_1113 [Streptomyces aidingensis]